MAYENGRWVNRFSAKRITKLRRKKSRFWYWNDNKPWQRLYLSGCRRYAKNQTNRKIRQTRGDIPNGGGYRKMWDYDNTLF